MLPIYQLSWQDMRWAIPAFAEYFQGLHTMMPQGRLQQPAWFLLKTMRIMFCRRLSNQCQTHITMMLFPTLPWDKMPMETGNMPYWAVFVNGLDYMTEYGTSTDNEALGHLLGGQLCTWKTNNTGNPTVALRGFASSTQEEDCYYGPYYTQCQEFPR